jgi:4-amino-4-deoxy-L-arabinose transferase-like glycosyltransferase
LVLLPLVVGLLLRLLLVGEMAVADLDLTPDPHRDMRVFWENAGRIAAGDWLLARGDIGWEDQLDQALGHERRQRLYGEHTYYNGPLYLYLLAAGRLLWGDDPYAVLFVQALLSTATVLVLYLLARLLFDEPVALLAAALLALQDTTILYSGFVLRETLFSLLLASAALLAALAARRPSPVFSAATGAVLGAAWLTRGDALLLAPFLFLAMCGGRPWRQALARAGMALGAMILCISPFVARNLALGVPTLQMSCYELMGVVNCNLPTCRPTHMTLSIAQTREVIEESDGRLLPAAWLTLSRHGSPWQYLRFLARKVLASWNAYEPWNNGHVFYFRRVLLAFRPPLVGAGLLLSLGLVGLLLNLKHFRPLAPLYGIVLATFSFMAVSYVLDRYRLIAYPALCAFAASAAVEVFRRFRDGRRAVACALVASAVALAWLGRDRDSAPQVEGVSAMYPALYRQIGKPWAARYLIWNARDPTAFERAARSAGPR